MYFQQFGNEKLLYIEEIWAIQKIYYEKAACQLEAQIAPCIWVVGK